MQRSDVSSKTAILVVLATLQLYPHLKLRSVFVKHAGTAALDTLDPLLARIRAYGQLKEKKRGCFYMKGKGFLHFHEDAAGLFADLSTGATNERIRVSTPQQQRSLLSRIAQLLRDG